MNDASSTAGAPCHRPPSTPCQPAGPTPSPWTPSTHPPTPRPIPSQSARSKEPPALMHLPSLQLNTFQALSTPDGIGRDGGGGAGEDARQVRPQWLGPPPADPRRPPDAVPRRPPRPPGCLLRWSQRYTTRRRRTPSRYAEVRRLASQDHQSFASSKASRFLSDSSHFELSPTAPPAAEAVGDVPVPSPTARLPPAAPRFAIVSLADARLQALQNLTWACAGVRGVRPPPSRCSSGISRLSPPRSPAGWVSPVCVAVTRHPPPGVCRRTAACLPPPADTGDAVLPLGTPAHPRHGVRIRGPPRVRGGPPAAPRPAHNPRPLRKVLRHAGALRQRVRVGCVAQAAGARLPSVSRPRGSRVVMIGKEWRNGSRPSNATKPQVHHQSLKPRPS